MNKIPRDKHAYKITGHPKIYPKISKSRNYNREPKIIKNDYLYLYGPNDRPALKKDVKKAIGAIWMYNNKKPYSSLSDLTPD